MFRLTQFAIILACVIALGIAIRVVTVHAKFGNQPRCCFFSHYAGTHSCANHDDEGCSPHLLSGTTPPPPPPPATGTPPVSPPATRTPCCSCCTCCCCRLLPHRPESQTPPSLTHSTRILHQLPPAPTRKPIRRKRPKLRRLIPSRSAWVRELPA